MLLEGKKLLVTGVLMDSSIAFHIAKLAQEQGAEVVLTSFGRTMKITTAIARRLPQTPPVVELDVTSDDDLAALADRVREHVPHLDGVVHSIGFAPQGAFNFMEAGWDDVSTAVQVSAYSLASLTKAALPADVRRAAASSGSPSTPASPGRSTTGWAWRRPRSSRPTATSPATSARRASAATSSRPGRSARPPRSRSPASSGSRRSGAAARPLGWDVNDAEPAARACVALLSDWFPATTGEMVHVDGGFHAMGV